MELKGHNYVPSTRVFFGPSSSVLGVYLAKTETCCFNFMSTVLGMQSIVVPLIEVAYFRKK